jgi:HSP20 family protein
MNVGRPTAGRLMRPAGPERPHGGDPMSLMRRRPAMADLASMRNDMERLFDDWLPRSWWGPAGDRETQPALDLYMTDKEVVAKVALPGVKPADVDVTVADDMVTVTGKYEARKEKKEAGYLHQELSQGSFQRSFSLPTAVKAEAAKATFKDGLLTLTLPKTEPADTKRIKVEAS